MSKNYIKEVEKLIGEKTDKMLKKAYEDLVIYGSYSMNTSDLYEGIRKQIEREELLKNIKETKLWKILNG